MNGRRAFGWSAALGVAGLIYIVSVIVTGEHTQNGAWLVMVVVFIAAGVDAVVVTVRDVVGGRDA